MLESNKKIPNEILFSEGATIFEAKIENIGNCAQKFVVSKEKTDMTAAMRNILAFANSS